MIYYFSLRINFVSWPLLINPRKCPIYKKYHMHNIVLGQIEQKQNFFHRVHGQSYRQWAGQIDFERLSYKPKHCYVNIRGYLEQIAAPKSYYFKLLVALDFVLLSNCNNKGMQGIYFNLRPCNSEQFYPFKVIGVKKLIWEL